MNARPIKSEKPTMPQKRQLPTTTQAPPAKKTKGRVKVEMKFIPNKSRRYTTFSKRKAGLMKKAYELSALTGTQVMLLVASETGHVYTFATKKLRPMITSEAGKTLIQTCLNTPDEDENQAPDENEDLRMNPDGFKEKDLRYHCKDGEEDDDDEDDDEQEIEDEEPEEDDEEELKPTLLVNKKVDKSGQIFKPLTSSIKPISSAKRDISLEMIPHLIPVSSTSLLTSTITTAETPELPDQHDTDNPPVTVGVCPPSIVYTVGNSHQVIYINPSNTQQVSNVPVIPRVT